MDSTTQVKSSDNSDIEITIEMRSKDETLKSYLEPKKKKSLLKIILRALESKFAKNSKSKITAELSSQSDKNIESAKQSRTLQFYTSQANIQLLTPEAMEDSKRLHTINILSVQNLNSDSTIEIKLPPKNKTENTKNTDRIDVNSDTQDIINSDPQDIKPDKILSINNSYEPNSPHQISSRTFPRELNISSTNLNSNRPMDNRSHKKQLIRQLILETLDAILERSHEFENDEQENSSYFNSVDNVEGLYQFPLQSVENLYEYPFEFIDFNQTPTKQKYHTKFSSKSDNYSFQTGDNSTIFSNSGRSFKKGKNLTEHLKFQLINDIYNRLVSLEKKFDNENQNCQHTHCENSNSLKNDISVQCYDSTSLDDEKHTFLSQCNNTIFESVGKKSTKIPIHRDIGCNTSNVTIFNESKSKTKPEENFKLEDVIPTNIIEKSKPERKIVWDGKIVQSDFDLKQKVDEMVSQKLSQLQIKATSTRNPDLLLDGILLKYGSKSTDVFHMAKENFIHRNPSFEKLPHLIPENKLKNSLKLVSSSVDSINSIQRSSSSEEFQKNPQKELSIPKRISNLVSSMSLKNKTKKEGSFCMPNFWKSKSSSNYSNRSTTSPTLDSSTYSINNNKSHIWTRLFSNNSIKTSKNNAKIAPLPEKSPDNGKVSYKNDVFDVELKYVSNNSQIKNKDRKKNKIYVPQTTNFFLQKYTNSELLESEKNDNFEYDELIQFYEKRRNGKQSLFERSLNKTDTKTKHFPSEKSFLKLYDFLLTANNPTNYKILRNLYAKMLDNCQSDMCVEEQVILFKRKNQCSSKVSVQSDDSIDVSITLSELRTLVEDTDTKFL